MNPSRARTESAPPRGRSGAGLVGAVLLLSGVSPLGVVAAEIFSCTMELEATTAMLAARDAGQSREFLLRPLGRRDAPFAAHRESLQARLAERLRDIVHDIYAHPELHANTYRVYRERRCLRRNAGSTVPATLSQVIGPLTACQAQHVADRTSSLAGCIDGVLAESAASP